MVTINRGQVILSAMLFLLFLTGCPKSGAPKGQPPAVPPPPAQPVIAPVGTTGPGVFRTISSANRAAHVHNLKQIGTGYIAAAAGGQPPHSVQELGLGLNQITRAIYDPKGGVAERANLENEDIKYVILWGGDPARPSAAGASNTVLGYVKDVPTGGGVVLMLDGSIKDNMTAEEFKAAPKAAK